MTDQPNPLDPGHLVGMPVDEDRLAEVATAFESIREAIEALRAYDIGDVHPAVVFRPIGDNR